MKVTARMAVIVTATAVVLTQAVVAADFSVVGPGIGADSLYAEIESIGGSAGLCFDGAAAFIEACRTSSAAVATWSGWRRRSSSEMGPVCSPLIRKEVVHHYADRGFWVVAGSPVENVDFLLVDTSKGAEQSVVLESADLNSSLWQNDGIAQWEHTYSAGGFGAVYAAAGAIDASWIGRGL